MSAISASMKAFLESDGFEDALRRYCLDEGIGIFDKNRTSNIQTANNDVARSKDSRLQELVNSQNQGFCLESRDHINEIKKVCRPLQYNRFPNIDHLLAETILLLLHRTVRHLFLQNNINLAYISLVYIQIPYLPMGENT